MLEHFKVSYDVFRWGDLTATQLIGYSPEIRYTMEIIADEPLNTIFRVVRNTNIIGYIALGIRETKDSKKILFVQALVGLMIDSAATMELLKAVAIFYECSMCSARVPFARQRRALLHFGWKESGKNDDIFFLSLEEK